MNRQSISTEKVLAESVITLTLSKLAASASIIIMFILLSYILSTNEYGSFRQVWLINKSFMEIFAFGIPTSIFYFIPRLADSHKKIFVIQSFLLLSFFGILFSCLIFFFAGNISILFNNPELTHMLQLFCLYPLFVLPTLAVQSILVSIKKANQFAIYTIVDRILLLAVVLITILLWRNLDALFLALVTFALLELIASTYIVFYFMKPFKMLSKRLEIAKQVGFAFPIGLSRIVGIFNIELDKLIVTSFFSVAQFARYANGAFELPFVGTIAASVNSVLLPEYVRRFQNGDYHSILKLWHGAIEKVAILYIPLMVFLFVFASDFVTLLFSSKYKESAVIFQIYLIALLPKVTWYGPILVSMGHNKEPLYGSFIILVSNIVLNYLFIQWIGFTGPAIATVFATYILSFYYICRIKNIIDVRLISVFPWAQLTKMLLVAVFLGMLFSPLTYFTTFPNVVTLALALPGYAIAVYFVFRRQRLISDEDIGLVLHYISRITQRLVRSKYRR